MTTTAETKPAWDHHNAQEDGHLKAANKKEMSTKKAPKPPKAEKFAAMSADEHRKAEDKHYDMSHKHAEAGNKDKAAAHRALHDAHRDASSSHSFHEMGSKIRNMDAKETEEHKATAKKYSDDAFSKLKTAQDAHASSKTDMKKSVKDHLAEVEVLLK